MADHDEQEPSERLIRLLQSLLAFSILLLLMPCVLFGLFYAAQELGIAGAKGVAQPGPAFLCMAMSLMPALSTSGLGFALARSESLRLSFILLGIGAIGFGAFLFVVAFG